MYRASFVLFVGGSRPPTFCIEALALAHAALALAPEDCDLIAFRDEAKAAASIES